MPFPRSPCRQANIAALDEPRGSVVGNEDKTVASPIASDPRCGGGQPGFDLQWFEIVNTPLRHRIRPRLTEVALIGGEQAKIRISGTLIGQIGEAMNLRLQLGADAIEEITQR